MIITSNVNAQLLTFIILAGLSQAVVGQVCPNPPSPPSCSAGGNYGTWGWTQSWYHYFCGDGADVDLATTGLEPVVKKAWEDLHLKTIKADVCNDPSQFPKTYSVPRPAVISPYYWIGGFIITVTVRRSGKCEDGKKEKYTVEVTMNDHFDCDPGFGDTYHVKHKWTFDVCCCEEEEGECKGDPHFKTWKGNKFSYHGECDLVWLHHPGFHDYQGLFVHLRTTRTNVTNRHFSYIDNAAVRVGDDTLQLNVDGKLFVNGRCTLIAKNATIPFSDHQLTRRNSGHCHYEVILTLDETGASICLCAMKNFLNVKATTGKSGSFEGSLGTLGDYETGQFTARDGISVIPDMLSFVAEWQVNHDDPRLFLSQRFPQFPDKCLPPVKVADSRRLRGDPAKRRLAEQACAHAGDDMDECLFDVMVTGDSDLGQIYG